MAIKILFDANNRPIEPTLLLANKNGNILGLITNVSELRVTDNLASVSRMSFKVTKYYDNQKCNVWDDLVDFKLVYCIEWDTWFEATLSLNESNEIIKIVDCAALSEAELSQINLYGYEINTESDIAREDYKNPTIIYNPEDHSSSLIHRILTKAPHYTINHIDATLARIQRTFSFDSISILDAFNRISEEIGCIFIYGNESVKENGMRHPARTVSLYDLQQNCNDCGYRGEFTGVCPVCGSKNIKYGYGKDTTIFVNRDNLTDSIDFSVDTDSVKNCFRLEAGDDLMTATVINCNPNGTQYMWYISDAVKADMPKTLVDRINQYDKEYQFFNEKYQMNLSLSAINDYNRLVDKYLIYDSNIKKVPTSIVGYPSLMQSVYDVIDFEIILSESLMPKISMDKVTAQDQADLLTAANLSPVAVTNIKALSNVSADSNILAVAKIIVDSRYRVKIKESSFDIDSKLWVGNFSVTSYSDETDTAISRTISIAITDDYEQYVKQKLDKALKKGDTTDYSISGIFKRDIIISGTNYGGDFVTTLQKYSLSMLEIIHDCCRGCIDVLIEQGISDRSKQSIETGNLYDKFYHNYYHRLKAIEKEMSVRQSEIDTIHTLMNEIEKERTKIQSQLNFQDYLGDENWKMFSSYRREDKYSNHNFISDGLNNTQLFNNALDFLGKAQEELYKSATLQHVISAPLRNLLVIKEFFPLVDYFEVGNWIRIEVDGEIYKLRLLNYSIDYDNLENIDVEFSDVCNTRSGLSDLSSLYKKMTSISTSYDYYEKQAEKGNSSYETLNDFYLKGLDATLVKLVNNADDQDVVFDRHGMLFRQKDDVTNDFMPTQLKIINSTLAVTNDNWETAKTGVGKFIYFDPRDRKYKEGFGIIADTLVGDVVLSSELGIFNDECSIALDKNGFTLTTNTIGKNVFTIQKETVDANGKKIYDRQLYINDNGDIVLGGGASISWDNVTGTDHIVTDVDAEKLKNDITTIFNEKIDILKKQIDGKVDTWYQPNDPSVDWNTQELKNNHICDLWYNTDTNETFMYNGNSWDAFTGEVPQELWDKVDGKAQIFTTTTPPTPPYHKGDLWFAGANADIKTCITTRESGTYVESDWKKYNKYTDDTKVDDVISGLGFTTSITGTKVISPHIVGGDLKIGNPNSGIYYANIDTSGKLTATGVDIKGKIVATEGMIGNFNISNAIWNGMNSLNSENNGVYLGTDGIALGGGKFSVTSGGKLTASGVNISGTINAESGIFRGTIYAQDGSFRGTIYAQDGSFRGAITATSLTLLPGVTIDYGNISNKPEIPSVDRFISKDGIVGMTPSDGSTGFKVSSDGLLEASNAIIYGTIYASSGTIGGFNITSVKNDNDHAYGQTLYRQVKNVYENGSYYDYQAGIKGKNTSSSSTEATEAAFYIRKKLSSDTWANSTIPFYVRNNGYVYAENMNIGNTLYSTGVQRSESGLESKRYKVMESWVEKVAFGMLDKAYDNYATFNETGAYLWSKGNAVKVAYDRDGGYIELSPELDTTVAYLGNAFETWEKLYVQNIGDTGTPVNSGYFTNLYTKVNGVWTKVTGTSGEGTTAPTYTAGDGINISSHIISVTLAGEDSGGLKFNNYGNIAISTSFLNSRYSQINHTHSSSSITWSGLKSSNGDNNGHVHRGINNSSGYGLWINGSTMIYPASNADGGLNTTTVTDLNSGIDLGGRTVPFKGGYFKKLYLRNTDIESLFYLSVSGNTLYLKNNIDNSTISNVILPSGGNVDLSGYATQSWVKSSFGDTLSISGNVLYLKNYNGGTLSSVTLPSGGGGGSSIPDTIETVVGNIRPPVGSGTGNNNEVDYVSSPNTNAIRLKGKAGGTSYIAYTVTGSSSDIRLKNNISDSQINGLNLINSIKVRQFNWIQNNEYQKIGFIADELEMLDEKLTVGGGYEDDGTMLVKTVDSFYLQGYEIKAIQELSQINQQQKLEIQELKNTLLSLQGELSILKQKMEERLC